MTQQKLQGKVIKLSGEKSVKVLVTRQTVHPKFKKRLMRSKKYLVHDEKGSSKVGDFVEIISCLPVSKKKSFKINKILEGKK